MPEIEKLKIGMVTSCYHPVINGVVRMVELYRQQLEALGHEVTVFTFGPPHPDDGARTVRMRAIPLGKTGYFYRPNFSKLALAHLNKMDVVHCHHLFLGPEKLSGNIRPPVVYTNHTSYHLYSQLYLPIPIPFMREAMGDWLIRKAWPQNTADCASVIAPSKNIKNVMLEFGITAPIDVIYNGIELNKFDQNKTTNGETDQISAIYLGRLSPEKKVLELIDSLIKACPNLPNATFKLVGHGPLFAECQGKIAAANLQHQIRLLGWVPPEEVPALLASADFQITMSTSEVHPLAIIEGMAAGLPAVALYEGAMAECVGNGAVIAYSPSAWVSGVLRLAQSAELRKRLGQNAVKRAQQYDIGKTIEQTIALYQRVIAENQTN